LIRGIHPILVTSISDREVSTTGSSRANDDEENFTLVFSVRLRRGDRFVDNLSPASAHCCASELGSCA
jgi:hypothetical protein